MKSYFMNCSLICNTARTASSIAILAAFHFITSLYAALLLGYTIHFIYCIWGNLRITVAELIAAANGYRQWLLAIASAPLPATAQWAYSATALGWAVSGKKPSGPPSAAGIAGCRLGTALAGAGT